MKRILIVIVIIVLCLILLSLRYDIVNMYLSYKYPSPVDFYELSIPIEKGFVYSKTEKSVRIADPLHNSYSVRIVKDFTLSHGDSLNDFLEKLGHMVIKVENAERDGVQYLQAFSVDRGWWLNVSLYFPNQQIMIVYRGTKEYYDNFRKIIDDIFNDLDRDSETARSRP